ncbi:MAG: LamG domain-containing protein [Planctomycetes bacterium]|nr:LamG domain-containing protein [Planctomycetota bacterium]
MSKKLIYLVSFVLAFGMVLTSPAQAGLIGWWRFNEGSGDSAQDSSGNNHDGTLLGTPEWVAGPDGFGGALAFGPEKCIGVDCGVFDPTNGTGQFTITLWAYWDGTGTFQHFITKSTGWGADTMMFQYELWGAHTNATYTDRIGISYEPVGSVPFSIMPKNEWVHLAMTFDGTNTTLYVNGVDEEGPKPFSIGPDVDAQVEIGYSSVRPELSERTFHGLLDEVRIYDYALTGTEIQIVMQGGEGFPKALGPIPANGGMDQDMEVSLSWRPGDFAVSHDVYFGDNFNDVNEASRTNPQNVLVSQNQEDTTYDPPGLLEFGQSYYWRIDEFNDTEPNSPWKGNTWSFTVIDHFVVDNFEDYNDYPPDEIFSTWLDGWEDDTNGATVGHAADFTKGENIIETTIVQGGKQSMPFYYDNSSTANYSEAERVFNPAQDWTREGVGVLSLWFRGHPAYVGGFNEGPAGTYTMTASGEDIWANADEFHFAFKQVTGASAIIAKVESLDNTHPFAKAGVMIRDSLDADSRNVGVFITPENGVRFQYRSTTGGITDRYFEEGLTAPHWVKLERTAGGLVRAYHSEDGATWSRFDLTQVSMDMPIYVGLAFTSHVTDLTGEAKFSNISFPDTMIDLQWIDRDIGMLSNEAEPMYITVGDGSGTAATVYHANPDATLINTWTQWNVPLTDLSNQGIALTDVSKLAIGFGSADNPQPGGSGLVFFDDIRLYQPAPEPAP